MKINHHLNEQLLMSYAAGILPEAFDLVVATHLSICDECRAAAESYESLGGAVLQDVGQVDVSADALAATMIKIDRFEETPKVKTNPCAVLPEPLQKYIGGNVNEIKWKPLGMGVKQAIIKTSKEASARMLFIPAGCAVPDHGHKGLELTLVLQGAFADEVDYFARGDLEISDEDLVHTPTASDDCDCICLAATDAPLKFSGIIPRILQPIFRI